ncbi:flagellar basal-body MS-ring/collar protein FliF [Paracraurococcus ruber]|uniref:Flagellar M-ring protein n=1 Tax=Paracraurococcus ruber TaxID=77675 RepID=A0ABS1CZQ8_9PROT|nr:flagellar basal-body MS-ring/collar protein FliF [Paracraurococcus ruber]MBK1660026.1 flagellar M-ring protein FliF [Paracraurococcus ruber]TDG28629.1 flagellar M-ring protein FliF [Paracraurococcus ruber]
MSVPDVRTAVGGLEFKELGQGIGQSLSQSLARLGPTKLAALGGVALAALLGVFLVARSPHQPNRLLYSGLDPGEAGRIASRLEELKIPIEARGDGTILVPEDQVARLRMQLAAEGLPRQAGAGYELLDQANPMQMTSFMQRVQRLRALEGELARTILALGSVRTARVHVVLPEREGFSRETPPPTASVTVTTQGGQRLSAGQAAAIRVLVAGAVPRMRQEDVSVIDPNGVVLAAEGGTAAGAGRIADLKSAQEATLRRAVLELLEPIVGAGRVRAVAAVELEGARSVSREEKYDPLGQVERSRQTQTESESSEDSKGREPVTVGQNLPNQGVNQNQQRTTSQSQRGGETINYEISSRTEETVREPGAVRRLSVAVVLDGVPGPDGAVRDRSPAELERLATLVRSAVGFDDKRGDRVTVEQMRFRAEDAPGTLAEAGTEQASAWLWWSLPLGAAVLLGGAGLWQLRRRRQAATIALAVAPPEDALLTPLEEQIASISPNLKVTMGSLTALQEMVDDRPEEVLAVLRTWIEEGSPA